MKYLVIADLAARQHYKDRRPPWIKLHVDVLDDYSFVRLQDASKAHLMLLWVLASKMDNRIPYDLEFIRQKIGASGAVDIEVLVQYGFITVEQDASEMLAERKQTAMPETETETETETEKKKRPSAAQSKKHTWLTPICAKWEEFNGAGSFNTLAGQAAKALAPIRKAGHDPGVIAKHLFVYLTLNPTYRSITKFAQTFDQWAWQPVVDDFGCLTEFGNRMTRPQ